jgi:hypothetical protein
VSWKEIHKEDPDAAVESLKGAIQAEVLLMIAANIGGVDWCIGRLQQVKAADGGIESILDIMLRDRSRAQ